MSLIPQFFETFDDFYLWLQAHHHTQKEILVGYYKINTGKKGINWSESVDAALCWGWIDGVRKSIDAQRYCIRFTPRRPHSIWSAVNIAKIETLAAADKMQTAGWAAFEKRKEEKSKIYAYEKKEIPVIDPHLETEFRKHTAAWEFFEKQAASYKKTILYWVMSAKQESTRRSRLDKLIEYSTQQQRLR